MAYEDPSLATAFMCPQRLGSFSSLCQVLFEPVLRYMSKVDGESVTFSGTVQDVFNKSSCHGLEDLCMCACILHFFCHVIIGS